MIFHLISSHDVFVLVGLVGGWGWRWMGKGGGGKDVWIGEDYLITAGAGEI